MACGTLVIASKLPPTEEIITHNVDGILVRPDRPAELARAIRLTLDFPEHTANLKTEALKKIQNRFTWQRAHRQLQEVYNRISSFSLT